MRICGNEMKSLDGRFARIMIFSLSAILSGNVGASTSSSALRVFLFEPWIYMYISLDIWKYLGQTRFIIEWLSSSLSTPLVDDRPVGWASARREKQGNTFGVPRVKTDVFLVAHSSCTAQSIFAGLFASGSFISLRLILTFAWTIILCWKRKKLKNIDCLFKKN